MLLAVGIIVVIGLFIVLWLVDRIKLSAEGRYLLITGCDTGFGNLLAKSLDKKGCHVFATCLTSEGAESLKKDCTDRLHAMVMDVTDTESIMVAFETVNSIIQDDKASLWGLVNNAGVPGFPGYYDWFQTDEFRQVLEVNLLGPIEVTNVFIPLLRKGAGRVVNVSSGIALLPFSAGGYEMSKCGLEAFSDCLRQQMYHTSMSVHVIEPGFFATPITDADIVVEKLERIWTKMTQTQRNYYGRECIDHLMDNVRKTATSADPRLYHVTEAIEHALFAKYPWKRYPVSGPVRFILRPVGILPAVVGDFVLRHILRISLPKPKGAE